MVPIDATVAGAGMNGCEASCGGEVRKKSKHSTLQLQLETPTTNHEGNRQDRFGVSAAHFAADEGAGYFADGTGAAHEGVASVYHQGTPPGRELLLPHGGEARECAQDGLHAGASSTGGERRDSCVTLEKMVLAGFRKSTGGVLGDEAVRGFMRILHKTSYGSVSALGGNLQ